MIKSLFIISSMILLGHGCSLFEGNNKEEPLARVLEQYLYPSDISDAIPAGTSKQDSMILARRYVDTWVRDQLMLNQAEQALTEEQKDFEKQIAEYRLFLQTKTLATEAGHNCIRKRDSILLPG